MATNTSGGTTTSFMNTPQAVDDYYAVYEDCIYSFDVMCNDLGGNAKILWSIDDTAMKDDSGTGTYDLLSQDTACVPELSDKGARIWIESGKIRYDASVFNYLGAGESVCDKFTYAIRMSNGTLSWATVTITISGTNDGPDIRVGSGDTGSAGLNETNAGLCKTGTLTITDPDTSDTVSTTFALTGTTGPAGDLSNATLESMFSVTPPNGLAADVGNTNNLTWKFDSGSEAFNYLRAGQTLQLVYTLTVSDGHGGTDTQTVAITITGTNDAPVLSDTTDPSAVLEAGDASAQNLSAITGNFSVTDLDNGDTLDASVVGGATVLLNGNPFVLPAGASALTAAGAFSVTDTVSNGGAVNIGYSYDPGAANLDFLGAGESLTITYVVQVNDGTTNSGTQNVTFTITGTNDAPVLSIADTSANVTEDVGVNGSGQLIDSGALSFTDADVNDLVTISSAYNNNAVWTGGSLSPAQVTAITAGFTADGNSWDYSVANAALDFLGAGESITLSFTVTATDDSGAGNNSDSEVVTLTITGTNDAPVLTGDLAAPINEGGTYQLTTADVNFTDPDDGASEVTFTVSGLSNGTLYVNGIAASSFTGQQLADGLVTFTHNGSETLTAGFNISVEDGNEDSSAPVAQTFNFTVSPVNDAPVNTVPGGQSVNEDQTLVFSTGNGNAISISDVDAGSDTVQVTLSVASGTLALGSLVGLTVTAGANGSSTVTVQGTQAAINAGLQGLTYQGNLNFNGGDSLSVVTSDLGNSGSGGTLTDTDNVAITVNAVNDAPVNTVPGGQSVNEDQTLVFSTGNGNAISIGDVDAGSNTVQVTLSVASGTLTFGSLVGLTVTAGANGSSTVTVQGTQAAINAGLQGLTYQGNLNFNGGDSLSIVTSDLGNSGSGGTLTDTDNVAITVNAVNDAPVNTTPASFTTNEDTVLKLAGLSVTDVDAGAGSISVTLSVASGTLTAANAGGVSISGSGTGSIVLSGTLAAINTYLATVANQPSFTPVANANGAVTLTMTTSDGGNTGSGGAQSDTDNVTINISAVNDAPVNTLPASYSTNENTALKLSGLSVSDVDAGTGAVSVTLSVASGTLTAVNAAGVTVSGSGTGSITLSGTLAAINAYLATVADEPTYTPVTNASGNVTLTMTTSDNGNTGSGGTLTDTDTRTITIVDTSAPPTDIVFTLAASSGGLSGNGINSGMTLGALTAVDPDSSTWTFTIGSVVGQTLPAVTASPTSGSTVNLVTSGAIAAGNYQFTVTATDAQGQSFTETYTLSVGTTGGDTASFFTITAGTDISLGLNGGDAINGGAGDDALVGGANTDTLNGGLGNDQLVGGAGGDNFLFNTALNGTTNVDRILDFDASGGGNGDHIQLDDVIFSQLTVGTLAAANFAANAGGNATDANDYVLYDTSTGNLYYDADGNGAGAKVLFATITVAAGTIDPTDILIV